MFYIANETDACKTKEKTPFILTKEIYQKLKDFGVSWNFRPYVMEKSDLFEFETGKLQLEVFIIRRNVCIDTVLAVLGHPFPQDIERRLLTCTQNYHRKKQPSLQRVLEALINFEV